MSPRWRNMKTKLRSELPAISFFRTLELLWSINCSGLWDVFELVLLLYIWQCVSKLKLFKVLLSVPWWFTWHLLRKFVPYGRFTCTQIGFPLFSLAYRPYGFWHISRYLMANALVWKTQRWWLVRGKKSLFILRTCIGLITLCHTLLVYEIYSETLERFQENQET